MSVMKLIRYIGDYVNEKKYSLIYKNNSLDIINYIKIIDFSSKVISVLLEDKTVRVYGDNLVISKMMDNEILITGSISSICFD